ncbi:MAG TPA: hypothetical protein VFB62_07710 [Polyangiaceae bacterium]|nr:hypothetical protein [Polyangiaceae bacterium]
MLRPWLAASLLVVLACSVEAPRSPVAGLTTVGAPPRKPGESITQTQMCSCKMCEPVSCCHELDEDRPELEKCGDGYDFSRCGMPVTSCDSRCFQHRWRTRVEVGCASSRPEKCCHARAEM